jgi:hypothetical protein
VRSVNTQTYDMAVVAQACAGSDPARGAEELLAGLGRLLPDLSFTTVLTRGGWYRSGGVVDIDKQRVADSIRVWAEQRASGDLQQLLDGCLKSRLFATRLVGRTHYLTAQTGPTAADFVQLEVEELQEVLDRYLSDPDWLPDSLEEFIDPLDYPQLEPEPVGASRLVFRRMFSARELIEPLALSQLTGLSRFLRDWDASSAAQSGHLCTRWVLSVRESSDSDGEARVSAHPVSVCGMERLAPDLGRRGADLANLMQSYDRQAGYPMAWFFHMVASAGVAHAVGTQVVDDHDHGFNYLPPRDLEVLRSWVASPYRA